MKSIIIKITENIYENEEMSEKQKSIISKSRIWNGHPAQIFQIVLRNIRKQFWTKYLDIVIHITHNSCDPVPLPPPPHPSPPSQKNTISHELKKYLKKTFQDQKLRCKFNSKVFNINMKSPEKRILSELKEYQNYYTQVMWPQGRHILCEQKQYHETFSNQWFRR